jgi:hypothetical protein
VRDWAANAGDPFISFQLKENGEDARLVVVDRLRHPEAGPRALGLVLRVDIDGALQALFPVRTIVFQDAGELPQTNGGDLHVFPLFGTGERLADCCASAASRDGKAAQ